MLQIAEMALPRSEGEPSTEDLLEAIQTHIRKKRNVALDQLEFEETRQETGESFDEYYIRLQEVAKYADLCRECLDTRMRSRIIAGINDSETRRKILASNPPPSLQ